MEMDNIISFRNAHPAKPDPTLGDLGDMYSGPIMPHRLIASDAVVQAAQLIPDGVGIGREVLIGSVPNFEDDPWGLVIAVEAAWSCKVGNRIAISYEPVLAVLPRAQYGNFFAGEEVESSVVHLKLNSLLSSWRDYEKILGTNDNEYRELNQPLSASAANNVYKNRLEMFSQRCGLTRIFKKRERKLMNIGHELLGKSFTVPNRGDEPIVLSGIYLIEPHLEEPWKPRLMGAWQVEGYELPEFFPLSQMKPLKKQEIGVRRVSSEHQPRSFG